MIFMKRMKRIFASVLTLTMIMTGVMLQTSFADTSADNGPQGAYIYLHDPDVPYQYRSPHRYSYKEFGVEHNYYAPAIYRLLSGAGGNVLSLGYCCDLQTAAQPEDNVNYYYRRVNLEDAGYYSAKNARQIRRVLSEGFWVEPEDADNPQTDLSALIQNVESRSGGEIDIDGLTSAEAMSATQAAVWYYSNANDEVTDFTPYTRTLHAAMGGNATAVMDKTTVDAAGPTDMSVVVKDADTEKRINAVYDYLTRADAEGKAPETVIWDFEDEGYYVSAQKGADGVSFEVTAKFKMTGAQDGKDDLALTVAPVMKEDADAGSIAPFTKKLSGLDDENGIYTIEFKGISREQLESLENLEFVIDGTQEVEHDAYFYESQKDENGSYLAQCFVGLASGTTAVHREWTLELSTAENLLELIKYDEDSVVTEADPDKIEDGQFVKYASSDAAATGDNASPVLWSMIMLLSAIAFCAATLFRLKRR